MVHAALRSWKKRLTHFAGLKIRTRRAPCFSGIPDKILTVVELSAPAQNVRDIVPATLRIAPLIATLARRRAELADLEDPATALQWQRMFVGGSELEASGCEKSTSKTFNKNLIKI